MATMDPTELQYLESHRNETRQPNFIASLVIGSVLAYTAVALRLIARRKQKLHLAADDWWIIGSLVSVMVYTADLLRGLWVYSTCDWSTTNFTQDPVHNLGWLEFLVYSCWFRSSYRSGDGHESPCQGIYFLTCAFMHHHEESLIDCPF